LLPSPSLQCLPPHIFWSLHSIMSLNSSPSFFLLRVHTISTLLHLLCNVYHTTSSDLFIPWCIWPAIFLSLYYIRIYKRSCFPHLVWNFSF
jgi:hypothetical protein